MTITSSIREITPYIHWVYFFHSWGFQPRFAAVADIHDCQSCRAAWPATFDQADRPKAVEALQLFKEANHMLNALDKDFNVKTIFRLCRANADGDDLLLDGVRLPLLRQQTRKHKDDPFLCLSDFIRPLSSGIADTAGVFASTAGIDPERACQQDPYKHLLVQTLADRLAEAATEKMHSYVRKNAWGYAKDENLSIKDLFAEKWQGIRPAVGYPSLPDQSVNFILNDLLNMQQIGITLTENGAMHPHASVSGLMLAHPAARYFNIGKIGEDQLKDYAIRRGISTETAKKFLAGNL